MKSMFTKSFATLIANLILIAIFIVGSHTSIKAQSTSLWQPLPKNAAKSNSEAMPMLPDLSKQNMFQLSVADMLRTSKSAVSEFSTKSTTTATVELPLPNGTFQAFQIWESSMMEAGLAAKYPDIKTYILKGIDDPYASGRMMVSPNQFGAYFSSLVENREVFIRKAYHDDPYTYVSYGGEDAVVDEEWTCTFESSADDVTTANGAKSNTQYDTGSELFIYRMAIGFPGLTAQFHNLTTKMEVMTALVDFMGQVNVIYERDMSMRFLLVDNQDEIIFLDDATDPYTTNGGDLSIYENRTILQQYIGDENYDLGFVFVRGGCCGARGQVCTDQKEVSMNKLYSLAITCHEIGHQFSAAHTQSYCGGVNGGNEFGSGTTIMSYISVNCGSNSGVSNNIPNPGATTFFGVWSKEQMIGYQNNVATCGEALPTGNTPPTITVPADGFYLPIGTPFKLIGSGTDPDGDLITYSWEQTNRGGGLPVATVPTSSNGDVPMHRVYNPVTSPERTIPTLPNLLNNVTSDYERLPNYARGMKYALYARDNHPGAGGTTYKEINFNFDDAAGPFLVTSQNTCNTITAGTAQTITWDVASTTNSNVNAQTVNIELSIDGGYTWDYVLATATANDGTESVTLPNNICTSDARIKVEAIGSGYTFFDVNDENFSIEDGSTIVETPSAFQFDGVDDGIEINTTLGNFDGTDFTASAWIKTTTDTYSPIFSKFDGCTCQNSWFLETNNIGTLRFVTRPTTSCTSGLVFGDGSITVNDGNWHHVAVAKTGNDFKIYVDGVEDFSKTATHAVNNSATFSIGNSDCAKFKGEMTEIRFWSIGRTEMEISDDRYCRMSGTETGLELYYPVQLTSCGSCTNNPATDATANSNDGTMIGGLTTIQSDLDVEECPTCTNGDITINTHPTNASVANGANATFSVAANGNNISYQWLVSTDGGTSFEYIGGANADTYSTTANTVNSSYQYSCQLVNGCDVKITNAATITLTCGSLSLSNLTGEVAPCADSYYTYYVTPNPDVATWTWTVPSDWEITPFDNMAFVRAGSIAGDVTVMATDACNNNDSKSLSTTPVVIEITTQPSAQTVNEGASVDMTTAVTSGGGTTEYLWQESVDGGATFVDIENSDAATYNFTATIGHDDRQYRCVVENDCLRDTTTIAILTVNCTTSVPENNQEIIGSPVVCNSNALTYAIPPIPGAVTYNWTLPSGWTGTSTTNEISVTPNGSGGILSVSATNSCGTSTASTLAIEYNAAECFHVMHFDGTDDYLTAAQNSQYLDGDMTVGFWVKPERIAGIQSLVFNGTEFEIGLDNGQVLYRHSIYGGSYTDSVDSTFTHSPMIVNRWRHVTITRDVSERELNLYLDGNLVETKQWKTSYPSTPDDNMDYPLTFGAGANGLITHFQGCLDKVKIWNVTRTATEVFDDVYCEAAGNESDLLAYYDFEQGQAGADNSGLSGFTNTVSSTYPLATPNNLTMTGVQSNVVADIFDTVNFVDNDGDGFGGTNGYACGDAGTIVNNNLDANDNNSSINPNTVEICGNGIDDNGNGETDENTLALHLNGTDDAVNLGSTLGNFGTNDFSIEMKIKTSTSNKYIISKRVTCNATNSFWNIRIESSGDIRVELFSGSGLGPNSGLTSSGVNVADGNPHHIAVTRKSGLVKIYIDNVERGSSNINANLTNAVDLMIGPNICGFNGSTYVGEIDELKFWDHARSAAEIDFYKDAHLSGDFPGLIAYYDFNNPTATAGGDNTGQTTLVDKTGNYNGTLTGFDLMGTASNWIGNPSQSCTTCNITPALTNSGTSCTGENITFTATPAAESNYHFFADANLNGTVDGGESLQNGTSDTYNKNALSDGDIISVLVGSCTNAAASTVQVDELPTLVITNPAAICPPVTADLTAAAVTAGSDAGTLAYFTDVALTNAVGDPTQVTIGTYYISLTAANGCVSSRVVTVALENGCSNNPGAALAYDGNGDIVTVADDPLLDLTSEITIEFWCKPNANASGYQI
ncbi:MAG: LamG-like jellyroll fold domain-containing protein [Saprospiraceae bacterium]